MCSAEAPILVPATEDLLELDPRERLLAIYRSPIARNPAAEYLLSDQVTVTPTSANTITRGRLYEHARPWLADRGTEVHRYLFPEQLTAVMPFFGLQYTSNYGAVSGLMLKAEQVPLQPDRGQKLRQAKRRWRMIEDVHRTPYVACYNTRPPGPTDGFLHWCQWAAGWAVRTAEHLDRFTPLRPEETDAWIMTKARFIDKGEHKEIQELAAAGRPFQDWARVRGMSCGAWIRATALKLAFSQYDSRLTLAPYSAAGIEQEINREFDARLARFEKDLARGTAARDPDRIAAIMLNGSACQGERRIG